MKRKIILILGVLILMSTGFATGVFLGEKKLERDAKIRFASRVVEKSQKDIPKNAAETAKEEKTETKIEGKKAPEEAPPEKEEIKEAKFSFAILGDTQYFKSGTNGGYQTAVSSIKKNNPALVFGMGDLVGNCGSTRECEGKLNAWKGVLGTLSTKAYATQGNHDRAGKEKADAAWEKVFSNFPSNGPEGFSKFVYSFDLENSHFIVLDSDKPKENDINATQLSWLENDLAKNKKEHVFVFFHEPAYPTNSKIGESLDVNTGDRDRLWNILTKYKVKAVFSGHEHIQSRRKVGGLYQFGFGNTDSFNHETPLPGTVEYFHIGKAFGIVEINGRGVTIKTYSVQGELLDSFILSK